MGIPVIGDAIGGIEKIIGRFKKSDDEKIREQALEMEPLLLQLRTNLAEAGHGSRFVAGWRPAAGWVCVTGLFYQYVLYPLLIWIWAFAGIGGAPPPSLDMQVMMTLLFGMLGIGAQRSYDKLKGTDTKIIQRKRYRNSKSST